MSKWFSVPVTIKKLCLVEVEDDQTVQDAIKEARAESFSQGDITILERDCEELPPDCVENEKMMANEVLSLWR